MDFGKYCSLFNVLILFLQIKKYNQKFYICLRSSNIFRAYIMLIVKLEHDFQNYMTYKTRHVISNYHVGMLTNPINPTPKPNSSSGIASKQTLRMKNKPLMALSPLSGILMLPFSKANNMVSLNLPFFFKWLDINNVVTCPDICSCTTGRLAWQWRWQGTFLI